jgi:DNA adenine methylase
MNEISRSFLKWPGNKYRLVALVNSFFTDCDLVVEPFAGSGVFHTNRAKHQKAVVCDINPDLINLFKLIQSDLAMFTDDAASLFTTETNTPAFYHQIREAYNQSNDDYERALYFFYLNRHGYNGLVRYNLDGKFNVPFGRHSHVYFPLNEIQQFHSANQNVEYYCGDYIDVVNRLTDVANAGFYFDPPYLPLPQSTSNFTNYFNKFDYQNHIRLSELAKGLADQGAAVVISNHDSPSARELYRHAQIHELRVSRNISCDPKNRTPACELLAVFERSYNSIVYIDL